MYAPVSYPWNFFLAAVCIDIMGKHSCWHWCLCHMDCMKTGQHLGVSTSGPDQKIEYKEEMWWFCCLLSALKNKTDSRTKLFLNEAYRIFPVLTLCSELRHLPRVLMWGFRCVCSQQRQNLPAETHSKVLSTHKGSQGPWQPCNWNKEDTADLWRSAYS